MWGKPNYSNIRESVSREGLLNHTDGDEMSNSGKPFHSERRCGFLCESKFSMNHGSQMVALMDLASNLEEQDTHV